MEKESRDRINQMKTELYSRKTGEIKIKRKNLSRLKRTVDSTWGKLPMQGEEDPDLYQFKRRGPSIFAIGLVVSLVFFVTAASFATFFLLFNKNEVTNNIEMKVTGPNSIKSGEVLNFLVELENPTKFDYREIEFLVAYPDSTIDGETKSFIETKTYTLSDPLRAGGKSSQRFSAIFSGTMGDVKELNITAYYKAGTSSKLLFSKKIYKVEIESAPVSVEMEYPKEVLSKKEFEMKVHILSNTGETLNDLTIVSTYPAGFRFKEAFPEAVFSDTTHNVFKVEQLSPGEKKTIVIKGTLAGQNTEEKFFSFELGDSIPFRNEIRTLFSRVEKEITIKRPDIDLAITTKQDSVDGKTIVFPGDKLAVNWQLSNNLPSVMSDIKVTAIIPSELFEAKKVRVEKGFYDSNKNTIVWDKNTNARMKSINGNSAIVDKFELTMIDREKIAGYIKDPIMEINFIVEGTNFNDKNSQGGVLEKFSKIIKIPTEVILETDLLYGEGPFENTGKTDPVVGEATTYTAVWKISNTSSDILDVEVRAKLPLYVKFLGNTSPENAYVSYDEETREVVWRHNKIEAFIGYRTDPKTAYFQVEFIPSAPQVENRPLIIGEKILTANDSHTERAVLVKSESENSSLPDGGSRVFTVGTVQAQ